MHRFWFNSCNTGRYDDEIKYLQKKLEEMLYEYDKILYSDAVHNKEINNLSKFPLETQPLKGGHLYTKKFRQTKK